MNVLTCVGNYEDGVVCVCVSVRSMNVLTCVGNYEESGLIPKAEAGELFITVLIHKK